MCLAVYAAVALLLGFLLHFWYRKPFVANFREKCVLITGTDSGFGRQLALELDKLGVRVFAGCYTQDGAENLRQEASRKLMVLPKFDVTQEESLLAAKELLEKDLHPDQELWGLVNNAGIAQGQLFHLATLKDYKAVLEVNYFGVIRTSEIFMPLVKKSKGRIVNIISIMGRCAMIAEPYTCSKFALGPYNDGLRRYLKDYQVHVAAIEPGFFKTNITNGDFHCQDIERSWKSLPHHLQSEYGEEFLQTAKTDVADFLNNLPLARWNSLDLVTDAITHALFAKHPKSRYVCGLDAHFIYRLAPFLPDWIVDRIVRGRPKYFSVLAGRLQQDTKHQKGVKKQ